MKEKNDELGSGAGVERTEPELEEGERKASREVN